MRGTYGAGTGSLPTNDSESLLQRPVESGQYASRVYQAELVAHGMRASMSRKGNRYDNAVAERFFATLELERLMKHDSETKEEARRAIFRYIETWYNRKRRHSTLGYINPAEYETQVQEQQHAGAYGLSLTRPPNRVNYSRHRERHRRTAGPGRTSVAVKRRASAAAASNQASAASILYRGWLLHAMLGRAGTVTPRCQPTV